MSTLTPTPASTPVVPVPRHTPAALTILSVAAIVALLYFGRVFFITMVIAVTIAFLLDPLLPPLLKLRMPRAVASFIVCTFALLVLYLFGLALYTQVAGFTQELPIFSQRMNQLVDNVAARMDDIEKRTYQVMIPKRFQDQPPPAGVPAAPENGRRKRGSKAVAEPPVPQQIPEVRIHTEPTPLLTYVYGYIRSFYDVLLMASFVPFLVYFMLSWRDHLRRSFLYLFSGSERQIVGKSWQGVADMVRAYVIGNFILGLILSTLSCSFFFAIRLPYWPLVGPLSGFLSLVPYVGLPLSIIPPMAAGLLIFDRPAIYLLIAAVIAVLHLVAMNLLYPKVVGARVHLNPLVVTVAMMFWGTLWGGIGLVLAIPITAGIKAVCDNVTSLHGYGRLLGD